MLSVKVDQKTGEIVGWDSLWKMVDVQKNENELIDKKKVLKRLIPG